MRENRGFQLEKKTYGFRYLLLLPFLCSPLATFLVIAQKLVTGMSCVLLIYLEAGVIDRAYALYQGRAEVRELLPYLSGMLLIVIWKRMGYSLGRVCAMRAGNRTECRLREEIVKKCARVPYRLLENRTFQELKGSLLLQVEDITWTMLQQTGNALNFMVRLLGLYLIFFRENMLFGLLVLLFTIPVVYFSAGSEQRIQESLGDKRKYEIRKDYFQNLLRDKECIMERTLFSYAVYVRQQYEAVCDDFNKVREASMRLREKSILSENFLLNLMLTLAILYQAALLASGRQSLGLFMAVCIAMCDTANFLSHGINDSVSAMVTGMRFLGLLTAFAAMLEEAGTCELPAKETEPFEELVFEKVSFRYPRTASYILKDISFCIKKGEHCAFVGENGTGKTTIAKLLTGVYNNYEGHILLNGRELAEYEPEKRKAVFAVVFQDSSKYADTVAVNIALGDARSMQESGAADMRLKVEEAAERLGMTEWIRKLPQGFDTFPGSSLPGKVRPVVRARSEEWAAGQLHREEQSSRRLKEEPDMFHEGRSGVERSDGQWQRIILARLLVSPAGFWILDEPAAALDPIAESRQYEKFTEISQGKTTLSISHRLGSTRHADRIFVLKDGTIAEEGSHEELLKQEGLYARMYEAQRAWYQ